MNIKRSRDGAAPEPWSTAWSIQLSNLFEESRCIVRMSLDFGSCNPVDFFILNTKSIFSY
jgi:hypothetical protein